ncbi:MAG: MAPEG family protein [Gammaproteobacteria bacterium]|nr:MAPEG family protein [Gammaproteobacteria bacterium]MDH5304622.1 MAPEG family protein [Gammaproteobacteria bacterium]MDH5322076.1 MAPEG family protein [Gammaproteobacteria bacterium]
MSTELTSLVWVAALTAVMWIPYILNTIMVRGLHDAVGYPANPKPLAAWAERLKKAHYNAVENLVVFAALVLVLNATQVSNSTTVMACEVYFWARLVHAVVYAMGVPWLRTLAFAVSWACLVALLLQLL